MFLNLLSKDKQLLFRELDLYIAKADDNFNDKEKEIINFHCNEMQIDTNEYNNNLNYETTINRICDTFSDIEKRMIFLELYSLVISDDDFSKKESEIIKELANSFSINDKEMEESFAALSDLKKTYKKINEFIKG